MKWKDVICDAIHNRKELEILYSDGISRVIEPHTYGLSKANKYVVSAYRTQKIGFPDPPDWRLYSDEEIKDIKATGKTFSSPRPGYNPNPKNFNQVICKIK